jgi:hypothetical protein
LGEDHEPVGEHVAAAMVREFVKENEAKGLRVGRLENVSWDQDGGAKQAEEGRCGEMR